MTATTSTPITPAGAEPNDPAWLKRAAAYANLKPSMHDGLAIAAFITVWFMPLVGFILGQVSNSTARREGRRNSGLAVAATWLGAIGTAIWVLFAIAVIA
jgi:hypothetical protein